MAQDRIMATYRIETALPLEQAAQVLAGEQSTGTFVELPGETRALKERFRARVERILPLEAVDGPSLPGARVPPACGNLARYRRAEVVISFSLENTGTNLPALVSTVCGNLYELSEFSGIKLTDLDLPEALVRACPGPAFGVGGTRELTRVHGRPIIGTIIKPSVGLSPEQTARLVRELAEAGIDFIKDDELMADPPHSPLAARVEAVMLAIRAVADRTGRRVMYAFNISDEPEAMARHHDLVCRAGGSCVMVSLNSVGLAGLLYLRNRAELPIHGHRNGWGMLTRHPQLGIDFMAYQKLWRLAGVDHLHTNGLQNKFWEPDDSVVRSILAVTAPLAGGLSCMPVISSGQWGGQVPETYKRTRTVDCIYLAGGGVLAHPGGPAAGVRGIRQAWEAAVARVPLEEYARTHVELRQSLEKFGRPPGAPVKGSTDHERERRPAVELPR